MGYSNQEMEQMLGALDAQLPRKDMIGYAAARNARVLRNELVEYLSVRDGLVMKYGKPDVDEDGNETGSVSISPLSPEFPAFSDELRKFATIQHEPKLFRLRYEDAIGQLSGSELLELDWMFEEDGGR